MHFADNNTVFKTINDNILQPCIVTINNVSILSPLPKTIPYEYEDRELMFQNDPSSIVSQGLIYSLFA